MESQRARRKEMIQGLCHHNTLSLIPGLPLHARKKAGEMKSISPSHTHTHTHRVMEHCLKVHWIWTDSDFFYKIFREWEKNIIIFCTLKNSTEFWCSLHEDRITHSLSHFSFQDAFLYEPAIWGWGQKVLVSNLFPHVLTLWESDRVIWK